MNGITVTSSTIERLHEIRQKNENCEKFLRISVSSGGCSGFQYIFELDNKESQGDIRISEEESKPVVVTNESYLQFLDGAEIEFVKELGSSYFKVNNPNARAKCGCGSSFTI